MGGNCGRDRMVVAFTTTHVIGANYHQRREFEYRSWWDVPDATLCDKVCQWLATGRWFSPCIPVSSTNKTNCHHINWNTVESGVKHHKTLTPEIWSDKGGGLWSGWPYKKGTTVFRYWIKVSNLSMCDL